MADLLTEKIGKPQVPKMDAAEEDWEELYSSLISQMVPSRDEIVRATPAYRVLQCMGRPLRVRGGELYALSCPTTRIASFWSHSWHGPTWFKILTLFAVKNGMAAAALSTTSAVLMGILYSAGALPDFFGQLGWCSFVAAIVYSCTFVFWQSRQPVFVDRICIPTYDDMVKGEALISLGAFLKCADSMLVLWDPSFMDRLWCMFEVGAFLHSRQRGRKPLLTIRPTVLGPVVVAIVAELVVINAVATLAWGWIGAPTEFYLVVTAMCSVPLFLIIHVSRGYCRTVEKLQDDMAHFSIENLTSYCCTVDHKDPSTGEDMHCDRKIILQCIRTWFGTVQAFEQRVQSEVLQLLVDQLSNEVFSYAQAVAITTPVFWGYLDFGFDWIRRGNISTAVHNFMRGLTYMFAVSPTLLLLLFRLAYWVRRQRSLLLDPLVSLLVFLAAAVFFLAHSAYDVLLYTVIFPEMRILAGTLFSIPAFLLAVFVWRTIPLIALHRSSEQVSPRPHAS
ncbi:unnamed protein product [Symbiodinium sp. CCMP2592]|nr:unnamed protein product [Symbiodinium sp. CCMP2592]